MIEIQERFSKRGAPAVAVAVITSAEYVNKVVNVYFRADDDRRLKMTMSGPEAIKFGEELMKRGQALAKEEINIKDL